MSWVDAIRSDIDHAERLESDLPYFAERCLKLRPKTGGLAPFLFNPAQLELHRRLEEQQAGTGKVCAVVLKARQMGISTSATACLSRPRMVMLHASEASRWVSMAEQLAALLQTVPRIDGSEIVIETTGNEFGDEFHQFWRATEAGENEFAGIFLPWTLDPAYRATPPEDFKRTDEEAALSDLHGLDDEQLYWRRLKISEMRHCGPLLQEDHPQSGTAHYHHCARNVEQPVQAGQALQRQHAGRATAICWRFECPGINFRQDRLRDEDRFKSEYPLTP